MNLNYVFNGCVGFFQSIGAVAGVCELGLLKRMLGLAGVRGWPDRDGEPSEEGRGMTGGAREAQCFKILFHQFNKVSVRTVWGSVITVFLLDTFIYKNKQQPIFK